MPAIRGVLRGAPCPGHPANQTYQSPLILNTVHTFPIYAQFSAPYPENASQRQWRLPIPRWKSQGSPTSNRGSARSLRLANAGGTIGERQRATTGQGGLAPERTRLSANRR